MAISKNVGNSVKKTKSSSGSRLGVLYGDPIAGQSLESTAVPEQTPLSLTESMKYQSPSASNVAFMDGSVVSKYINPSIQDSKSAPLGLSPQPNTNSFTMSDSLTSFNNDANAMEKQLISGTNDNWLTGIDTPTSGSNGGITSYLGDWKNFFHGSYSDYKGGGGTMTETDWNAANNASDRVMLGAGMGLGQLGLGVMSYLGQKEMNKKNLQLADQQIANNSDIMATRKARQADIAKAFGSGSNAAKI